MQFMIVGPRLPTPVLDHRSASERAADAIAAIDEAITTPSERAERALRRIDKALRPTHTWEHTDNAVLVLRKSVGTQRGWPALSGVRRRERDRRGTPHARPGRTGTRAGRTRVADRA